MDAPGAGWLDAADALVAEYLTFRGFPQSLRALKEEREEDPLSSLNADRLVHSVRESIDALDWEAIEVTWEALNERVFIRLHSEYRRVVSKLRAGLQRLFLVTCIKRGASGRAHAWLAEHADSLRDEGDAASKEGVWGGSWRPWFALPHLSHPEKDAEFAQFFEDKWADVLLVSLRNFLASAFANTPLPRLLAFELSRTELHAEACDVRSLRHTVARLQEQLKKAEAEKARLEREAAGMHAYMAEMQSKHGTPYQGMPSLGAAVLGAGGGAGPSDKTGAPLAKSDAADAESQRQRRTSVAALPDDPLQARLVLSAEADAAPAGGSDGGD